MKLTLRSLICITLLFLINTGIFAKSWNVASPDKNVQLVVNVDKTITYSVLYKNTQIISPSRVAMTIDNNVTLGLNPQVEKTTKNTVDTEIIPVVKEKRAVIKDNYNELLITFKGGFGLTFRAYNDAAAYRFVTTIPHDIKVYNELASFGFAAQDSIFFPLEPSFHTSFERNYQYLQISDIASDSKAYLPVVVKTKSGFTLAVTESDLDDYPGMFVQGSGNNNPALQSVFAPYPLKEEQKSDRSLVVTEKADYIAVTKGARSFPWRAIGIADKDVDLIGNDIVYRLAAPLELKDVSWIKPGKVAWDWWNALNLKGVDFKAGINTETYKYYIDFASKNGLEYIILDEGWSDTRDLLKLQDNVDLKELIAYGNQKNVGIILWCVWLTVDKQLDEAFTKFEEWGVKGVKIDFMDRDDQKIVNWYKKIVVKGAEHHLLVDFHGAYKPTGLRRTFPNMITREGVKGSEYNKWSKDITPDYDVTLPYTRMFAGPMDYTPGAMRNTEKGNFNPVFTRPMSMGTRVHQLAMYVVFESPIQMLCDTPTNYEAEPDVMKFLGPVPSVWDETVPLDGKVSKYVAVARRSGNDWYIGAMTNWTPRTLKLDFSFLGDGEYKALIFQDGINAANHAEDYKMLERTVKKGDVLEINLAPGGGWAARLTK